MKKDIKIADYSSFIGEYDNQLVKVYINDYIAVRPGDSLLCEGEIQDPIDNTTPHLFNYRNYLKSQNIKSILYLSNCEIKNSSLSINSVSYFLDSYIDENFTYSNDYIKTFILADKSGFDDTLINKINMIGISHLFAVSGLHISLIVLAIMSVLKKANLSNILIENVIVVFLIIYMIITSFSPSVTRASMMFIFLIVNKRTHNDLSSLDILSLIFVILLLVKPYYYYDAGFLLSFLVTFLILLSTKILKVESKLKQLFILSTISFFVTIPIILNLNYQVNFLSLFFNILFLFYISYVILPLGYITFILPFLDRVYFVFISIFEFTLQMSSLLDFLVVKMYFSSTLSLLIYYIVLFYGLYLYEMKKSLKRPVALIITLLILVWGSPYYNIIQKVTFLDIYGDSTIITDRFDKCNIIIDTGEVDEYNTLVNYLKTNNIKRIDYLIITHYHSDHYGEANDLLTNFNVINLVNRENAVEYDGLVGCGNISFFIYQNKDIYYNENNRSIILSLFISDKHYLFTGDIELKRENSFIKDYEIDVDYLKVPHHGSITSSSLGFIDDITPEEVFIIVSRKNRHNHPSDIVVSRYEQLGIKVYRTDLDGTVIVRYIFGKEYKKVHRP
ncbi:MAG: DNA internalization-related competence protein ComEC/Rec2, partial [Candidatus Izimaplasma sp.]|nr:DNA internalization-related competence protein ComEC/Rec2 [Candidatus Izimaplasma bacterium]